MSNGIKMPRFPSSFISGPSPRSIYLGRGEELIFDADIRGRKFTHSRGREYGGSGAIKTVRGGKGVLCLSNASKGGTNERSSMRPMNISRGVLHRESIDTLFDLPSSRLLPLWESCLFFFDFWKKWRKDTSSIFLCWILIIYWTRWNESKNCCEGWPI